MSFSTIAVAILVCLSMFAAPTSAQQQKVKPLIRDFMGTNTNAVEFRPEIYSQVCRLVRDYHMMHLDFDGDTSNETTFPMSRRALEWKDESGKFRDWNAPMNWGEHYSNWKALGIETNVCLQFIQLDPDKWTDMEKDAFKYGKAFAEYFGPSGEHKLVTSAEIGNEPRGNKAWTYKAYQTVFRSMAKGLREGDPKIKILMCAAEAGEADRYSMPLDILKDDTDLFDAINVHKYAMIKGWPTWERYWPEYPELDFHGMIQKSIDWRNQHAPGKEVWITEFGYDASTKKPPAEGDFKEWKQCTDLQQAQWLIRSFLFFCDMDVERAYMFYYNDQDEAKLHAASGITRNYEPKMSFWAMKHLYDTLGDYRFVRAVEKVEDDAWIFEFAHETDAGRSVWVAWSPTGKDRETKRTLKLPGKLIKAERMAIAEKGDNTAEVSQGADGAVKILLTESPVYLWVQK